MSRFRVWAPAAARVDLEVEGERHALRPEGAGWWAAELPGAGPGTRYRFSVDGGEPRPDPRSPWQPDGVHGPSATVDHAAFPWSDGGFRPPALADGVVYELHVGTFTPAGTFEAAIERLGHLVDLGVTHVELMPVAAFPGVRGWGYDGVDLFAPHTPYGGPDGLKRLVDACHARGLAVLLDVVYNHLGPSGNYLGVFGPYFTDRYATPWGQAINLDGPGSDEVRAFFIANARAWIRDYHFDGLRLDAVHALVDLSAVHFLEELSASVDALAAELGRPVALIAESDLNDPRLVRSRDAGGYGLAAAWSDDFHHALHAILSGEVTGYYEDFGHVEHLAKAITRGLVYDGVHSAHRRRRHGRSFHGVSGHALVGFVQNHDQIGNRARGDRLGHLVDADAAKVAGAILLLSPLVPLLFQGQEWASSSPFPYVTDHDEPELGRAVREGRQREFAAFGWRPEQIPDPQAPETFDSARLDWDERERPPHAEMLAFYRELLRLRRETPALRDGRFDRADVRFDERAGWLTVERGAVLLAAQLRDAPARIPLPGGPWQIRLASRADLRDDGEALPVKGRACAVLARAAAVRS